AVSVVVAMAVLLVRVEADVAAVGIAGEEVIAVELADRPARGLGARVGGRDVVDAEPQHEAALYAHIRLGLAVVGIVHDELRVLGSEPGRVGLRLRFESGDLGVEADDLRAFRGERHHRAQARHVLVAHTTSTASATASPPPRHSETIPRRLPRARNA